MRVEVLFPWILLLHVLGAIVAFGPTFAFPLIGAAGGAEPMHVNFSLRVSLAIAKRIVWPLALFQGVTGLALMGIAQINPLASGNLWLAVAIVLYVVALVFSYLVTTPNVRRLIELTSAPPPAGSSGPPPEVPVRAAAARRNGTIQLVLVVAIVFLMVVKPF